MLNLPWRAPSASSVMSPGVSIPSGSRMPALEIMFSMPRKPVSVEGSSPSVAAVNLYEPSA